MFKSNKKGVDVITEPLVFIIINLIFFSLLLFFVIRSGSGEANAEEVYAKKIALILDNAQPNMEMNLSIALLIDLMAKKNIFNQLPVSVNNNLINVKITKSGGGYSFSYFSNVTPSFFLDRTNKMFTIKT